MSANEAEKNEDPMIGDILSSIKSIINESEEEPTENPLLDQADEPKESIEEQATQEENVAMPIATPQPASPPQPITEGMEESILSQGSADLGTQQFVKLNNMIRMGNSNVTLSDITRSLLRPMLREWLDENLPPMVERMVEYEIKRLVSRIDSNRK